MTVPYDSYDYPGYWKKRKYEDLSEKIALKKLFREIPKKNSLIDIGGGYGRFIETYTKIFKKCLLIDPSEKLLELAKKKQDKFKNIFFKQGKAEKLPVKANQFDVVLMIRVIHHLPQLEKAFKEAHRVLKPGGFLILEFANKIHLKSTIKAIFKRKLGYLLSHAPENISSKKSVPFFNYHPSHIKSMLIINGFKIKKTFSVSNFRNPVFKKLIPLSVLLFLESHLSLLTSHLSLFPGPSIFILAQKKQRKRSGILQ